MNRDLLSIALRPANPGANTASRWWIYQKERFPVLAHGVLIAAFSFSAVSFSWLLRGDPNPPSIAAIGTAFVTAFILFFQLRVADEFKDFEEDSRHRPYRPVPRGLITLGELRVVAIGGGLLQLALALWLAPSLAWLLLGIWVYLALMTREFFVRDWIRERPVTYLWSHMLIVPLVDLYGTACDWRGAGVPAPGGLFWFIAVSFFNGVALELGRKIRAPEGEEDGVRTYSRLWGRRTAVLSWLGALLVSAICAVLAAARIGFVGLVTGTSLALFVTAVVVGVRFLSRPCGDRARWLEHLSGLWTLILYLSLGAVPWLWRVLEGSR